MAKSCCDYCSNLEYDEQEGITYCIIGMDEDEMARFLSHSSYTCPYFHSNNEYEIVNKQI